MPDYDQPGEPPPSPPLKLGVERPSGPGRRRISEISGSRDMSESVIISSEMLSNQNVHFHASVRVSSGTHQNAPLCYWWEIIGSRTRDLSKREHLATEKPKREAKPLITIYPFYKSEIYLVIKFSR